MPEIPAVPSDTPRLVSQEPLASNSQRKSFFLRFRFRWILLFALLSVVGYGISVWLSHRSFQRNYQIALTSIQNGHYSVGANQLAPLLQKNPNDSQVLLLAIRATRGLGEWEDAERLLEKYLSLNNLDENAMMQKALIRAEQGNIDSVRAFLMTRSEQNYLARIEVLEALIKGSLVSYRFSDCEDYFNQWIALNPVDPKLHFLLGRLYEMLDYTKTAIASYQQVLVFCPTHSDSRTRLVRLLLAIQDSEGAKHHCEIIEQQGYSTSETKILHAQALINLGQQSEANQLVDAVLERDPHHSGALTEKAQIAMHNGQDSEAEKMLQEVVEKEPSNTKARYQYVLCLKKLGKEQEAKQQNERMTQMDKDIKRMQAIVTTEMQAHPRDIGLRYEVGMIAMRAGLAREGARWLKTVLELDPNHSGAHEALAGYYQIMGYPGLAFRHLELANRNKLPKD